MTSSKRVSRAGPQVRVERACDVEEVWTQVNDAVEHELFVRRAPGKGALRVRLRVNAPWHHVDASGHLFSGPGASDGWTYGEAFVLSGGARAHVDVVRTEGGLELIIPSELVRFPLHIDPLVFPAAERIIEMPEQLGMPMPPESDEGNPSVTWNTDGTYGVVAYSDDRRGVWPDLFGLVVSFDAGLVLSTLVPFPAAQLRPAVMSTQDGGIAIAFEDYSSGATTPSLVVAVLDDFVNPSTRRLEVLANARAPSFTWDPQVGVVLGYAQTQGPARSTLVVRSLDAFFADAGTILMSATVDAGLVERTSVASLEGKQAMAIELASHRVRFFYDNTEVLLPPSAANTAVQSSPSVVMTEVGERYVVWSEDGLLPGASSVQVRRFDNVGPSMSGGFPGETQAALVSLNGRVLLLSFSAPSGIGGRRDLVLRDLTRDLVLGTFSISRSGGLGELAAESRGTQILLAWTDRTLFEQRNVNVGILRAVPDAGFEANIFWRDAVPAQHDVRVSFRDELGLVVWREASNALRGQWVNALGQPVVNTFPINDGSLAVRFDGLDVAVGDTDALIAVRAYLADGRAQVVTFRVAKGASSVTTGQPVDLQPSERPPPPQVAYSGGSYFIGTALAGAYQLVGTNGNATSTPRLIPTSANATSFDLDCIDGHCALAWAEPAALRVVVVRDITQPLDVVVLGRAPGPVTLTNDGEKFYAHWQAPNPDPNTSGAVLLSAAFAPGDQPQDFATTPLRDERGNTLIAATIDGAGTQPHVVAVTDNGAPSRTWLVDLSSPPPWRTFDSSTAPRAVATSKKSSTGVLVFERFGVRQASEAFVFPWGSTGTVTPDAGSDAGVDADGGTDAGMFRLTSTSCGSCSSATGSGSSGWLFVVVALGALLARRARRSGTWVVLLVLGGAGVANAQISPAHDLVLSGPVAGGRLPDEGYAPAVATSPDGGPAVVVWVDTRRGEEDLFGMRVNGPDAGAARPLVFTPGAQTQPALAFEATGSFVIAWQEFQGTTPVVRVTRMNPQTMQVMLPAGTRPSARAPSLYSDKGAVWVCFESLAGPMGAGRALTIQAANDLITGVGSNAVVLGNWATYDAGVVNRTACARDGQHTLIAAETTDETFVFNDSTAVSFGLFAGARISQPVVYVGSPTDNWVGVVSETGMGRSVEVYELSSMGPLLRVSRSGNTTGTLLLHDSELRLASFQASGAFELVDVRNNLPVMQSASILAAQPSLLVSSSSGTAYLAWQETTSRRSISAALLSDTGTNIVSPVYPRSPVVQRDVKVSFLAERGIAVWQIGNDVAQFVLLDHARGTNRLALGMTGSLFGGPPPGEITDQAVAMGKNGALVLTRYRLNGTSMIQAFYVALNDGSVTRVLEFAGDQPAISFDGNNFNALWMGANGLQLTRFGDAPNAIGATLPLQVVRPVSFELDCREPDCFVGLERQVGGLGWLFTDQTGASPVDPLATTGPITVTSGNDDRFYLAWKYPAMAKLSVHSVAPGDNALTFETALDFSNSFLTLQSARGVRPWLATSTVEGDLFVARANPGAQFAKMINGRGMDLTSLDTDEGLAVLGFTAFDNVSGSMLPHALLLKETPDAGADGGVDGGQMPTPTDGGVDAGTADGGVQATFELRSRPCSCDASGGAALVLALLIISWRSRARSA